LDLKEEAFIETFLTGHRNSSNSKSLTYITIEGTISIEENFMNLIPNKVSWSSYDIQTKEISAPYQTFTSKDHDLNLTFNELLLPTSNHKMEYSVSGNTLTFKIDNNNDGDSLDFGETIEYTRQ
jgi:hypothetical protein